MVLAVRLARSDIFEYFFFHDNEHIHRLAIICISISIVITAFNSYKIAARDRIARESRMNDTNLKEFKINNSLRDSV